MEADKSHNKTKCSSKLQVPEPKLQKTLTPQKINLLQVPAQDIPTIMQFSPLSSKSLFSHRSPKKSACRQKSPQSLSCGFTKIIRKIVDGVTNQFNDEKKLSGRFQTKVSKQRQENSQSTITTKDNSKGNRNEYSINIIQNEINELPQPRKLVKKLSEREKDFILLYRDLPHKTPGDKINYHLDVLSILSDFVESWWRSNQDEQQWEELYFLIYKKFYMERIKVQHFLKKYPMKNPFKLHNAHAETKQILQFMKLSTGKIWLQKIIIENVAHLQKLRDYYNVIIAKSGGHINLLQVDNFSQFLHKQLWNFFIMLEYNSRMQKQRKMVKLSRILQIGFIILQLQGKKISQIDEADAAIRNDTIQQYLQHNRYKYESNLMD